ncbi:MAG: hypothetical protein AT708_02060 [Pyrobaculum sp. OCT_11]|nr:MAG: hypothetical protein AT708_02060 [Pyrobaculum sp. OCT_11]
MTRPFHDVSESRSAETPHQEARSWVVARLAGMGWGSSLGCLWLGEVAGRVPEAVLAIRRDVQAAGLQLVGGVSSRRGWPLKMSVVAHVGGPVAKVLGVGVQCAGAFIFLVFGRHACLAPTF